MKLAWLVIVFICGAMLPLQGGLNARLGKSVESPVYASMITFVVGSIVMGLYILFTKESFSWAGLKSAPVYSWVGGGILGAIFITGSMLAIPRLGMALTFGLVIAGQIIIAVLLDHFNVLVDEQRNINIWRLFGIALIMIGVIIVRKF